MKKLAMKAHLEAKQSEVLRHDLAVRIKSSDGPFSAGQRVFFWMKDHSKIKGAGEWCRGKVVSHLGPMVTISTNNTLVKVNQSKVRKDHDEWHDVPLPPVLEEPLLRLEDQQGPATAGAQEAPAGTVTAATTYKATFLFR